MNSFSCQCSPERIACEAHLEEVCVERPAYFDLDLFLQKTTTDALDSSDRDRIRTTCAPRKECRF